MRRFDKNALVLAVGQVSPARQTAFALAIATRQLRRFEKTAQKLQWEHVEQPRLIVEALWEVVQGGAVVPDTWQERETAVLSWIPHVEDEGWTFEFAFVQEALSSLVYSIRSLLTANPEECGWAATAAYEAADQAAIWTLAVAEFSPETELALISHPIVQRELERQAEALDILSTGSISDLQTAAFAQDLLTDEELGVIASNKAVE